jgi:phosphate transport system substrate-binding protein
MIDPHPSILAAAIALSVLALPASLAHADDITLVETGSMLIYPLFNVRASEYTKTHPGVRITIGSTGSAAGIEQAISGAAHIGTSDAYMTDAQAKRNPQIINVPMAISALTVNYNLPGLNTTNLKLDSPVLVGIYTCKIRSWDDKAIVAPNSGLPLPHHEIIPVRRTDGSGDTYVFTQYLTFSTQSWEDKVGMAPLSPGQPWQATWALRATLESCRLFQQTPYAIGYLGISLHIEIADAQLGTALLKSYSGEFLLPTPESIAAAAASLGPRTPRDERLTLVNAPGANAYPLVNYE